MLSLLGHNYIQRCSQTSVTIQETHEVPADDPVTEELDVIPLPALLRQ